MKFPFRALPGERTLRPVVDIAFPGLPNLTIPALVDSGAFATRVSDEFAEELGVDLAMVAAVPFSVGLGRYHSRRAITDLTVRKDTRPCEIEFVSGWGHDHALLGLRGFFDNYVVRIDAVARMTELRAYRHPAALQQQR